MQKFTEKTYLEDDACLPETHLQDEAIFSGFEQTEKVRQKMYALLRQIARNSPTKYLQDDACSSLECKFLEKRICKTMHAAGNVSARRCNI